jgi:hypothetical protein
MLNKPHLNWVLEKLESRQLLSGTDPEDFSSNVDEDVVDEENLSGDAFSSSRFIWHGVVVLKMQITQVLTVALKMGVDALGQVCSFIGGYLVWLNDVLAIVDIRRLKLKNSLQLVENIDGREGDHIELVGRTLHLAGNMLQMADDMM